MIAHSTGGLVARTYIESDAYGDTLPGPGKRKLPKIYNLIMVAVPDRGASKAWNPLHNNWNGDGAYRFFLSKMLKIPYKYVTKNKRTIAGPPPITRDSIVDVTGQPSQTLFIDQYVPTIRSLLATYPFLDKGEGVPETVNNDAQGAQQLPARSQQRPRPEDHCAQAGRAQRFRRRAGQPTDGDLWR